MWHLRWPIRFRGWPVGTPKYTCTSASLAFENSGSSPLIYTTLSQLFSPVAMDSSGYDASTMFLGQRGRFQTVVFALLCLCIVPNGFTGLSVVFVADTPEHRCRVPAELNLSVEWRNAMVGAFGDSLSDTGLSRCSRLRLDAVRSFLESGLEPGTDVNLSAVPREQCRDGWEYDTTIYSSTIVTEWDLVCEENWRIPFTSSIFFCGVLVGSVISGHISDRFGRKMVLFISLATQNICSLLQVFSPSWPFFCALFFIMGMGHISYYVTAFILGIEILSPPLRETFSTLGVCFCYTLGYMLFSLAGFFLRDWRSLTLALSIPGLLYLTLWRFIPESPRWLLSQGRVQEAEDILRKAARMNGISPPEIIFPVNQQFEEDTVKTNSFSLCELVKSRNICFLTGLLSLIWCGIHLDPSSVPVNDKRHGKKEQQGPTQSCANWGGYWQRTAVSMGYCALSLSTSALHGNVYLNCLLSALVEAPAVLLAWMLLRRWPQGNCLMSKSEGSMRLPQGRCLGLTLGLGGSILLIVPLIPEREEVLTNYMGSLCTGLVMLGKLCLTTAFALVYALTAELYPTGIRNSALGICSMASRAGSISAPYLIYLGGYNRSLPFLLIGSINVLSGLLSLLLPESQGSDLPDSISQMKSVIGLRLRQSSRFPPLPRCILRFAMDSSGYDASTVFLGHRGRFQSVVFALLCVSIVPNGFTGLSVVFVADTPEHRCRVPAELNLSVEWRNAMVGAFGDSLSDTGLSRCSRLRLDAVRSFSERGLEPGTDVNLSAVPREQCRDGWEYDTTIYSSTIVTEWDLVCEENWRIPFTSSLFFCGVLVGSVVSGTISDRFGRKTVLFITMAIQSMFSLLQVFSPSWPIFCALFFIVGMGHISNYVAAFVLGMEILSPSLRDIFSTLGVCLFFTLGYMLLPLAGYFLRDWRSLTLALSIPGLLCLTLWRFIPESPRWLLSQGRVQEAEDVLRKAAQMNGISPPEIIFPVNQFGEDTVRSKSYSLCELVKSRNIRCLTGLLALIWTAVSMGYCALSLSTSALHGNVYLNCLLSALVEAPAVLLAWMLLRRWPQGNCLMSKSEGSMRLPQGRCLGLTLGLGGSILLIVPLIPEREEVLTNYMGSLCTGLVMLGKLGLSAAFALVYPVTAELYPTGIRNSALGICSMASRAGSISAPYLIYLGGYNRSLPFLLIGSINVLSGLLSLLLPESQGSDLPDSISQMKSVIGEDKL
ncbi:hypothetical protein DNTS_022662 [Danionella cerebrum]|uniref:Solute carrier family 22 member 6 n=1 Tax=Danionella cerebrum TaxID=2873325 RepID=A0A553NGG5_9TELE|nr:hypothetical protein DNTS_022662 [Danionella translucida]